MVDWTALGVTWETGEEPGDEPDSLGSFLTKDSTDGQVCEGVYRKV